MQIDPNWSDTFRLSDRDVADIERKVILSRGTAIASNLNYRKPIGQPAPVQHTQIVNGWCAYIEASDDARYVNVQCCEWHDLGGTRVLVIANRMRVMGLIVFQGDATEPSKVLIGPAPDVVANLQARVRAARGASCK